MPVFLWVGGAVALSFLYLGLATIRAHLKLRQFGGPWLAGFTDLWFAQVCCTGRQHIILGEVVDKYGHMSRVGPNMLITDDEEFARKMNQVRSPYSKSDWYKALKMDGHYENVLSHTDHAQHLSLRNKLVNGYAGTGNPNFESDIDVVVMDVVELINTKYISKGEDVRPFDHSAVMQYLTLDVVTSLSLGKAFGYVKEDKDIYEYIQTMWVNFPILNLLMSYTPVMHFLQIPVIQRMMVPSMKDRTGLGKIKRVAFDIVSKRFAEKQAGEKNGKQDMMDNFIKQGLSEAEIADNVLCQLLAGSDTTVSTLRSSFVQFMSIPRVYARLQAECDEVAKEIPVDKIISYQRAIQMPYLDACIKEALRYYPAATGFLPRQVPKGGDWYDGKFIPEGTIIGVSRWNMTRKNKVYGLDHHVFRPERWLESSPEQVARMEKSAELLFNVGRHRCLGERIALFELYKMTFELMRRFDLANLDPFKPLEANINYGIWMQKGMWLRVEKRNTGGLD